MCGPVTLPNNMWQSMAITEADRATIGDILQAETMIASSWPALRLCLSGRWLLGMADGVSGRANSLFFLDPSDDRDTARRLDWMEDTYRRHGLPPRVRLSPLAPVNAVTALQERSYRFQNPTLTLRRPLESITGQEDARITQSSTRTDQWLDTFIACTAHYQDKRDVLTEMLDNILDETCYFLLYDGKKPVSTAMSVTHLGVMTIQNVATHEDHRRQGFAESLMRAVLEDGNVRGVEWCWIAVEQSNAPALSLYQHLGFQNFYRYIYASLEA